MVIRKFPVPEHRIFPDEVTKNKTLDVLNSGRSTKQISSVPSAGLETSAKFGGHLERLLIVVNPISSKKTSNVNLRTSSSSWESSRVRSGRSPDNPGKVDIGSGFIPQLGYPDGSKVYC
ncbi:hypothetical protein NPIL_20391 [Nephila pilipes]|uniref:Uncharacterized protein n=1 Tax=Nephila pilipes TaxID=299642 RepID=A0A8X6P0D1_NEPPI|nr:hypothetical protein NPIL_20391 [Nephila pilipes]